MGTIATLTMNPALDVASTTKRIIPAEKLRCTSPRHDPGGGGINVARAIHRLGGASIAVFPAGGPAGQMLRHLLDEEGVSSRRVPISGLTRESFTIDEEASGRQFRFVMPGPPLAAAEQELCLGQIWSLSPRPQYIVASGSLPPEVPDDFYARMGQQAARAGIPLIVDTSGSALQHAGHEGIYLLKPSLRELQELVGRELDSEQDRQNAARDLIAQKRCQVVVLSLGAAGAILATKHGCRRFAATPVPVRSTVGAGDSMVAGIVLGLARGWAIEDAVRFGMAAGAAALMKPGTELCSRYDAERLFEQAQDGLVEAG
jgi:6-phosphofructokinase 2